MDAMLDYSFGSGDGELSTWHSPADFDVDGDGRLDAVTLDFDGDGLADDVMWDSDGDGRADRVVLDGGGASTVYADSGRGLWDVPSDLTPGKGPPAQGPAARGRLEIDDDGDGVPDQVLVDTNGDGFADAVRRPAAPPDG
ncbi:MAG: hypothetical protein QM658_10425 [Gordonia sp. (in: high G+C Gram-positive bacteria)]